MREEVLETLDIVVNSFGLHGRLHVDLDPISQYFVKRREDLRPLAVAGYCTLPRGDMITPDDPVRVVIDHQLDDVTERIVYAHEIGHGIMWNAGELAMGTIDQWFVAKAEREAWEVASVLLVPWEAIQTYGEVPRIARMCGVPEQMVEMAAKCYWG